MCKLKNRSFLHGGTKDRREGRKVVFNSKPPLSSLTPRFPSQCDLPSMTLCSFPGMSSTPWICTTTAPTMRSPSSKSSSCMTRSKQRQVACFLHPWGRPRCWAYPVLISCQMGEGVSDSSPVSNAHDCCGCQTEQCNTACSFLSSSLVCAIP